MNFDQNVLIVAQTLFYLYDEFVSCDICALRSQCVAVCCSVLQCVAVCCSVMQCVAVSREWWKMYNWFVSRHRLDWMCNEFVSCHRLV